VDKFKFSPPSAGKTKIKNIRCKSKTPGRCAIVVTKIAKALEVGVDNLIQ